MPTYARKEVLQLAMTIKQANPSLTLRQALSRAMFLMSQVNK